MTDIRERVRVEEVERKKVRDEIERVCGREKDKEKSDSPSRSRSRSQSSVHK